MNKKDADDIMTNQKNLSPVVIFVYKRVLHTKNLLMSLAGCDLADQTEVYIYSDGPKRSVDKDDVDKVRTLIKEKQWQDVFAKVTIFESEINKGLANSIISGASEVIEKYGKVLVLEDDLIVAPYYLKYMNQALDAFENQENIFAVAGWTYPINRLKNYKKDAWLHYRPCSWGWGTWLDRWDQVIWDPEEAEFEKKLNDSEWRRKFDRAGNDLAPMLRRQLDGKSDSWAIRWTANQTEKEMLAVFPKYPVVYDDGRDGSGTHAHADNQEYDRKDNGNDLKMFIDKTFCHSKDSYDFSDIVLDELLIKSAWNYDSDTIWKKFKRNSKKIFVEHKIPDFLKKK